MSRMQAPLDLARTVARSRAAFLMQIAVTLALTVWIVLSLGAPAWAALRGFDPIVLVGSILLFASAQIFGGLRLAVLLRGTPVSAPEAVVTTWIGYFFSNFLPSTVGGDIVRLARLATAGLNPATAFGVLVLDRILNVAVIAVIFALSATSFLLASISVSTRDSVWLAIGVVILSGLVALAAYAMRCSDRLRGIARAALQPSRTLLRRPGRLIAVLVLSILNLGVAILAQWFIARRLGIAIHLLDLTAIICLVALVVLLPISFNGLGLQEGAYAFFLVHAGASLELALVYGLLTRALIVGASALAGLVVVYDRVAKMA
jgi:uncharacterized membrane protein YbhN (UPF0104 family)